jgi:hypothetical protein
METPKVYQPGEGSEVEVPDPVEVEEGFKEDDSADAEADDSYAKHRSENR